MSYRLLLTFAFLCLSGSLLAQRIISDARIIYKMELPAEELKQDAKLEGSTFTQYMRGPQGRIDMNFNIVHYTYLINSKEETMTTLIDQHGTKYLIRVGKEQYQKDLKQYENIQFKDQPEVKKIAGYDCRKAIGTMPDGQTFEVFYATDLIPENRQYNRRFVNLKGIPLEFEILTKTGAKTRVIATKVELSPIPASYFDIPKTGYKEVSQQELQNM